MLTNEIFTCFSLFMNVSKSRPNDAPVLIVYLVGGVSPSEVKLIKETVDSFKSSVQVCSIANFPNNKYFFFEYILCDKLSCDYEDVVIS